MEIPNFASREEKAAWWSVNKDKMAQERAKNLAEYKASKSKIEIPENVRIVYLRVKGVPVGILATRLLTKENETEMEFQFSAYNRHDRYDKHFGKELALDRLAKTPYSVWGRDSTTPAELKYAVTQCIAGIPYSSEVLGTYVIVPKGSKIIEAAVEWLDYRNRLEKVTNKELSGER